MGFIYDDNRGHCPHNDDCRFNYLDCGAVRFGRARELQMAMRHHTLVGWAVYGGHIVSAPNEIWNDTRFQKLFRADVPSLQFQLYIVAIVFNQEKRIGATISFLLFNVRSDVNIRFLHQRCGRLDVVFGNCAQLLARPFLSDSNHLYDDFGAVVQTTQGIYTPRHYDNDFVFLVSVRGKLSIQWLYDYRRTQSLIHYGTRQNYDSQPNV